MKKFNSMELIISKPDKLKPVRKLSELTITIVFWFVVFYLWQPIISLLAWALGYKWYYEQMIALGGSEHLLDTLFNYFQIIMVLSLLMISWAFINIFRFKNKTRRTKNKPVSTAEIANQFNIDYKILKNLQDADNVSISFNQDFEISTKINKQ